MNQIPEPDFTNNEQQTPRTDFTTTLPADKPKENMLAGIVGAFLFSLAGGILWFILYQIGILAGISGIVGVICAIKGYSVFAKGESVKGIIISVAITLVVIVAAWYACLSYDVYKAYQEWYIMGDIDYSITFFDAVRGAYLFLEDSEIATGYFTDLGFGVLLCIVGCFGTVRNAVSKAKTANPDI